MRVLAAYNIKGGVGKTATAVNLAYLSAYHGARTLVWDLDPQGAATFYFRVQGKHGGGKRHIRGKQDLDSLIRGTDFEQLDLLRASFAYRNLDQILADDVVFHSPVVHTPQEGKAKTKLYLKAAFNVFPGTPKSESAGSSAKGKFSYVREVVGENDAILEFMTEIDDITINGVDMIRWNDDGE